MGILQEDLLHWVMDYSQKLGCEGCRARISSGVSNQIEMRNGEIEVLQQSRDQKMIVSFFIDQRFGSVSSNRFDREELMSLIKLGVASTRLLEADLYRKLPDSTLYYVGTDDLEVNDLNFETYEPESKIEVTQLINDSIWGSDERLISLNSSYSDAYYKILIADTQGLDVSFKNTFFSASAQCSVRTDGDYRPEASDYSVAINRNDLQFAQLAIHAQERALARIGQRKVQSGSYMALVDHRSINTLLSPIVSALYGSSIYQKDSFLADRMGEKCFSPLFHLEDRPLMRGVLGASLFDREGIATKDRVVFDKGYLQTYFIDTYYGGKLAMNPTIEGASILTMTKGVKTTDQMIQSIDKGVYITGFNGGNCNGVTGDYSYGVEGFWVEHGVIQFPISEMNITGNMFDLWLRMVDLSKEVNQVSSWQMPSILFEQVDFSGK